MTVETENAADRIQFLKDLRSVRTFSKQPVPDDVVEEILEVGRWSGSAGNTQPWQFIVVRDPETKLALSKLQEHTAHLAGADFVIAIAMDGMKEDFEIFDDGKVSERMMLAASAHGVGSSIGWVLDPEPLATLRSLLQVPGNYSLRTLISFGYPARSLQPGRTRRDAARNPLNEIVSYERFGNR